MKLMVFDVGGTEIKYSVMDETLERRQSGSVTTPMTSQKDFFDILCELYAPHRDEVEGIAISLPGFIDSAGDRGQGLDMSLIMEGTEQGLMTLVDWMDDCKEALLRDKLIPGTDLSVEEESITYSLYTDQSYVVDRRPIYYGFVSVVFNGYADQGANPSTNQLLV